MRKDEKNGDDESDEKDTKEGVDEDMAEEEEDMANEENRGDYEDFWLERDKMEGLNDSGELVHSYKGEPANNVRFKEKYTLKKETIKVKIRESSAFFEYSNGTSAEVPLDELKFCPSCVKEGMYPFSRDGVKCPVHKTEYFNFDMKRYEEFKVLNKLNGFHRE